MPTPAHPPTVHAVVRIVWRQKSARLRLLSAAVSEGSVPFAFKRSENKSPPPTSGMAHTRCAHEVAIVANLHYKGGNCGIVLRWEGKIR
jgi:hypothetical protein